MKCLKCGRETEQTFCEICRESMKKYPVNPKTIVLLPKERVPEKKASARFIPASPEAVIASQKRTIRRLRKAVAVLCACLAVMAGGIWLVSQKGGVPPVGQNYSTVTKSTADTTPGSEETTGSIFPDAQSDAFAIAPAELEDYLASTVSYSDASPLASDNGESVEAVG